MPIQVRLCRQDSRTYIAFLFQQRNEMGKNVVENQTPGTFVHLEMGVKFLVCAEGLCAIPMITLVRFCPRWSMFASHVSA